MLTWMFAGRWLLSCGELSGEYSPFSLHREARKCPDLHGPARDGYWHGAFPRLVFWWRRLSALPSSASLGTELLVDLRPVFEGACRSEDDPVVNLAVGQYEADRCPLGYGRSLEDKRFA